MPTAIATSVVVTILTTNVADTIGQGEWSFAACHGIVPGNINR